jgi:hypothetical protein
MTSTAALALNTLSFCAAGALLIGAYKAHNTHKSRQSLTFLTTFSLVALGLLLQLIVDTEFAHGLELLLQQALGITSSFLRIISALLLLSAYTLLLFAAEKIRNPSAHIIAAALITLTLVLATQYFLVAYAVTALILALLAHNFYNNFLIKASTESLIVYLAFLALFIGHLAALLAPVSAFALLAFFSLQLTGYFLLFAMLWRVSR